MNAETLAEWLQQHLRQYDSALKLNLKPEGIRVKHVLNWGGFVNHSFHVTDGVVHYHLKLTNDGDCPNRFKVWRSIHQLLERRYRAPELIRWVDFAEIGFSGMVMRYIEGRTADFCQNPELVQNLIQTADRLHHDAEIRSHLQALKPDKTYCDHFVETYVNRFTSDLTAIAAGQPPFVSSTLFRWMADQTHQLRKTAGRQNAFQGPALSPVHSDLNEGNVLVTKDDWFILDWDDLDLGDPAVEFAVLLWPMIYSSGKRWEEFGVPAPERGFAERIDLCLRAQLLDEVIDNLADYVQAHAVPSRQAQVQLAKRKRHEEALKQYTARWSNSG